MEQVRIRILPQGKLVPALKGSPLKDALHSFGVEFPCGGKGSCGKCQVRILKGLPEASAFHQSRLEELDLGPDWRLACLTSCEQDMDVEIGQFSEFSARICSDESSFEFETREGIAVALDVGTTTMVAQLLDLSNGQVLGVERMLNPQSRFGSDLISRLEAALDKGPELLSNLLREAAGSMVEALMAGQDRKLERVDLVGNTVMQHFFCGSDIRPLSYYPFESPNLEAQLFTAKELGWDCSCSQVCFHASIGSFVGSDILAGILATGMHEKEGYSVLVDLGTNGEIVVGNKDKLLCASTAAGPAFEGARISQGMLAVNGAVNSIFSISEKPEFTVIGNEEALGICGSGLIDAVGVLLEEKRIGQFGEFLKDEERVNVAGPITMTQGDIQEFQLAKAAIAAGIEILLDRLGITPEQVDEIHIAGGFGSYINLDNALRTNMLNFPKEKINKHGNTALLGAKMLLAKGQDISKEILKCTTHINLEGAADFQDLYVKQMGFEF